MKMEQQKRNYFILRRGNPWTVRRRDETWGTKAGIVCEYRAFWYDGDLIDKICFAKDDDEVKALCTTIPEITDKERMFHKMLYKRMRTRKEWRKE